MDQKAKKICGLLSWQQFENRGNWSILWAVLFGPQTFCQQCWPCIGISQMSKYCELLKWKIHNLSRSCWRSCSLLIAVATYASLLQAALAVIRAVLLWPAVSFWCSSRPISCILLAHHALSGTYIKAEWLLQYDSEPQELNQQCDAHLSAVSCRAVGAPGPPLYGPMPYLEIVLIFICIHVAYRKI